MGLEIKFYIYISTACHLIHFGGRVLSSDLRKFRDVGDGWAGWAIANRGFGRSPKDVDCAPLNTTSPPSFR